jgi:hypothetical protein
MFLIFSLVGMYLYAYGLSLWNIPQLRQPHNITESQSTLSGILHRGIYAGEYRDIHFSQGGLRMVEIKPSASIPDGEFAFNIYENEGRSLSMNQIVTGLSDLRLYVEKGSFYSTARTWNGPVSYTFTVRSRPISDTVDASEGDSEFPVLIHWDQVEAGRWKAKLKAIGNFSKPLVIVPERMLVVFPESGPKSLAGNIAASGKGEAIPVCLNRSFSSGHISLISRREVYVRTPSVRESDNRASRLVRWDSPSQPLELELNVWRKPAGPCEQSLETSDKLSRAEQDRMLSEHLQSFETIAMLELPPERN